MEMSSTRTGNFLDLKHSATFSLITYLLPVKDILVKVIFGYFRQAMHK